MRLLHQQAARCRMVRCGGEKPPHAETDWTSKSSGAACDGLHGETKTQRDYKLTRPPQPQLETQFA
eukprot:scaffold103383_cov63-Phaeocystis_antarctica.AAC.3